MTSITPQRKPSRRQVAFLLGFHATIAGAFLVSYLTGDGEDIYFMHVFAGYAVLAALALRFAAGIVAGPGSILRLPRPDWPEVRRYVGRIAAFDRSAFARRSPLLAIMAIVLLVAVGAAAASGAVADFLVTVEDLHEALGELSLYIVIGHIAMVVALHGLRRLAGAASSAPTSPVPAVTHRTGGGR